MSMRFAMLTTFYPPFSFGGDAIGVERLAHALVRRGHHVTVIHDEDAYHTLAPGRAPPPAPPPPAGLEVVALRSRHGIVSNLLTHQFGRPVVHGRRIARILRDGAFDVVHFHNVSLLGGPGLLKYGSGVKLLMAHDHWLVCPTHVLWRHQRELCSGRECLKCVVNHGRPPQLWRWTGLLERELRHVDAFIAMSEFSRAKHVEFGFRRELEVLPYFLPDLPPEASAEGGAAPPSGAAKSPWQRPYFLFVGRLERIKGLDDVIPFFANAGESGADLVIAGEGDHGPALRTLAHGSPRVHFLGRVAVEQLAPWYRHALALVVPSVCFETFGIVLIEAFRQRLPVIARRLGPFPEIVAKAQAGELFTTTEELRAALQRLQSDPGLRARQGAAGFAAWRDHWSEAAVVPKYLDLVRRVAERKGRDDVVAKCDAARDAGRGAATGSSP
jgi:glycosyltransferase involved in cell wall biosynthesis